MRILTTSVVAGTMMLMATAAFAATGEFDNMCAEGLAQHKSIKTDCSVNTTLEGKTYCFGDEKAKSTFMQDPKGNLAKAQSFFTKHQG